MAVQQVGLSFLIGGIINSSFTSSIRQVSGSVDSIGKRIRVLSRERLNLSEQLRTPALDTNVREVTNRIASLRSELVNLRRIRQIDLRISSNVDKVKEQFSGLKSSILGATATLAGFTYADSQLKQAQGEIASLGINTNGINAITKAAKDFSNQWAGSSAPDFIRASYDIKSGIASLTDEGVAEFTKMAALTGTATKSSVADMTKLFALGYGIFRKEFKSDNEFASGFSNIISASVQAFRTDGPDLINGISNLGATATAMGVSLAEQLSIIGVSKEAFNSASDAATGYRAFLGGVGNAQKKLGLQFTDAYGNMLPMVEILEKIKEKFGDNLESVKVKDKLKEAFGSEEAAKTISALINKTESLKSSQETLSKEMNGGNKTEMMARAMQAGREFERLKQQLGNLASSIGGLFAPAVNLVVKGIGSLVLGVQNFIDNNKAMAQILAYSIGGLFIFNVGLKAVLITKRLLNIAFLLTGRNALLFSSVLRSVSGINLLLSVRTKLATAGLIAQSVAMKGLSAVTKIFTAVQWALNAAFIATPIGWIIAGIAAIAGSVYLLIKNWASVKDFFINLWENIKSVFAGAFSFISAILSSLWEGISSGFSNIVGFVSNLFQGAVDIWLAPFKAVGGAVNKIKEFFGFDSKDININESKTTKSIVDNNSNSDLVGKYYGEQGSVTKTNQNIMNSPASITYSPQIVIQGSASRQDIDSALSQSQNDFNKQMKEYQAGQARLSYGASL